MKAPNSNHTSRRTALKGIGAMGTFGALCPTGMAAAENSPKLKLRNGSVVVFQGDSITDAGRDKSIGEPNNAKALGKGYAAMVAGGLLGQYADLELKVYNRGISGNKIPDLAALWKEDAIDLKPDVLSILIGINDLWHTIAFGSKYKGTIDDYEEGFRKLIEQTQRELPDVQIVMCEPFTLRKWPEFDPYIERATKLAKEFNLTWVPFHSIFDKAADGVSEKRDTAFWLWDGIHPTIPGHALMADAWRAATGI